MAKIFDEVCEAGWPLAKIFDEVCEAGWPLAKTFNEVCGAGWPLAKTFDEHFFSDFPPIHAFLGPWAGVAAEPRVSGPMSGISRRSTRF
ncbi:MAG: hypothetical protein GY719_22990 [bacterium]|nr:hypothetical protein [bacterium]